MRSSWLNQWYWGYLVLLDGNDEVTQKGPAVRYQVKLAGLGRMRYVPDVPYRWKFTRNSRGAVALADMEFRPFVQLTPQKSWCNGMTMTYAAKEMILV